MRGEGPGEGARIAVDGPAVGSGPSGHPRRSSFCHSGGCVVVELRPDGLIEVSRSDDPFVSAQFDADEWDAFLAGVRNGEFDVDALRAGGPS